MIITSSWFTPLPAGYCRIGISRGVPRGQKGYRRYSKLNPGPWFNSVSPVRYRQLYFAEVLDALDPEAVVSYLMELSGQQIPVLLCWEAATPPIRQWCHRALVSAWLHDRLGLQVHEFGLEAHGFGWSHPLLEPSLRQSESTHA
jgi:hypothetical protein